MRRIAIDFGVPLVTNAKVASMLITALLRVRKVCCVVVFPSLLNE